MIFVWGDSLRFWGLVAKTFWYARASECQLPALPPLQNSGVNTGSVGFERDGAFLHFMGNLRRIWALQDFCLMGSL